MLRYGFRPSKVAFWPGMPGVTPNGEAGHPGFQSASVPRTRFTGYSPLAHRLCTALLLVQPVQTIGDAERTEGVPWRLVVAARGLAAPSDMPATVWLTEIEREIPEGEPNALKEDQAAGPVDAGLRFRRRQCRHPRRHSPLRPCNGRRQGKADPCIPTARFIRSRLW